MMILVVHEDTDLVGPWISGGLSALGESVISLTESQLAAANWRCEVENREKRLRISLDGEFELTGNDLLGIVNRVENPGMQMLRDMNELARGFTPPQLFAFHLCWLNRFSCPVFNQTRLQGACVKRIHLSDWLMLAIQSGLKTPVLRWDPMNSWTDSWQAYRETRLLANHRERRKLFVIGECVVAPPGQPDAPASIAHGCVDVSKLANKPMMQLNFVIDDDNNWVFLDANSTPEIHLVGEMGLNILSQTMKSYKASHYCH